MGTLIYCEYGSCDIYNQAMRSTHTCTHTCMDVSRGGMVSYHVNSGYSFNHDDKNHAPYEVKYFF